MFYRICSQCTFQAHFSKHSLYNHGDIIGGCDIRVCTGKPGTPSGAAYANTHASSGIRIHDASNQVAETYALERTATGTGHFNE
jgi:hypothetical protein